MIAFTNRLHIARDPGHVFRYLCDPTHLPDWNYYVRRVTPLDDGSPRVGARYLQQRRTDRQVFEIARLEAGKLIVLRTLDGQRPAFVRSLSLSPARHRAGTVVIDDWRLDTGHPAALQQLGRHAVQHGVQANLGKLKQLLETSRTTLQDGRVITLPGHVSATRR